MKLVDLPTLYFDPLLQVDWDGVWVPVLLLVLSLFKSSSQLRLQRAESLGRILLILDYFSSTVDTSELTIEIEFWKCPITDGEKIQISS